MSHTIPLEEASNDLTGLVRRLAPGDEVILTENDRQVARIVAPAEAASPSERREPGAWKGMLEILADDDEHLADFKDYM